MMERGYGIWLSYNNQEQGFPIPILPASLEVTENGQGTTYDISGSGEINVIQNRKLSEISFKSIFPAQATPLVTSSTLLPPFHYVEMIQGWMDTKRPIRFVYIGSTMKINMAMSIEKFNWQEVAGAVGDIEYALSLKKYVFYAATRVDLQKQEVNGKEQTVAVTEQSSRPDERSTPKTYTLAAGDNLWKVAQKFLGDGTRYKEIQTLNRISDAQLKKLSIGMELRLPQEARHA